LEKVMCPIARAVRWVGALEVVEMRWISCVGVRWGREDGVEDKVVVEVVEKEGVLVEWYWIRWAGTAGCARRWSGMM